MATASLFKKFIANDDEDFKAIVAEKLKLQLKNLS